METFKAGTHEYKELHVDADDLIDTLLKVIEEGKTRHVYLRKEHGCLLTPVQVGSRVEFDPVENSDGYVIIFEEVGP